MNFLNLSRVRKVSNAKVSTVGSSPSFPILTLALAAARAACFRAECFRHSMSGPVRRAARTSLNNYLRPTMQKMLEGTMEVDLASQ